MHLCLKTVTIAPLIETYCMQYAGHDSKDNPNKTECDSPDMFRKPKQLLQQPLRCTKVEGCIYPSGHKHLCDTKRPYQGSIISG